MQQGRKASSLAEQITRLPLSNLSRIADRIRRFIARVFLFQSSLPGE
jgi:hypothetical protein